MKNIHVLPKDKPSKLFIYDGRCGLSKENQYGSDAVQNQVIYITNQETMKEGDWFLDTLTKKITKKKRFLKGMSDEKIILTTDQDLIEDGVQSIPDDFLEWFVKNPSCEKVEVKCYSKFNDGDFTDYKIIIPKEEPKFENSIENSINVMSIANSMFGKKEEPCEHFTPTIGCIKDVCSCNKDPKQIPFKHECRVLSTEEVLANRSNAYEFIDFEKQETLEEAVEECLVNNSLPIDGDFAEGYITGSIFGAKWQQEQDKKLYSDLVDLLERLRPIYKEDSVSHFKCEKQRINIIEQFKNK